MKHILLLGAGFSRNWGGLLASEAFEYLIGCDEVIEDEYLKTVLWKFKSSGFENALSEVQDAYRKEPSRYELSLRRLQGAISDLFEKMNNGFFDMTDMEFQQDIRFMLREFLFKFDSIFTLNQDVLLDHHYLRHLNQGANTRWRGACMPGLQRIPDGHAIGWTWGKDTWRPESKDQFHIPNDLQPYLKLHGSSNWVSQDQTPLLVMGGNKAHVIASHELLAWYFDEFKSILFSGNVKLFVIGYGFRDHHINDVIIKAVKEYGLKLFVIDPSGSDVCLNANDSVGGMIVAKGTLDYAFEKGLVGASRRGLKEIFGGDQISHDAVMKFFN